ncbi:unnamed protein product [Ectocarpus sp. CCAP 1310/34]|nr:unnamed protein product [Ectocarpus sp. CCAP 1310/34]
MEAKSGTGGGGSIWSDGSTNLANVIRGLPKFDGTKPEDFNDWMKKLGVVVGVTRRDIMPLLKGMRRPDPSDTTFAAYERANEDLYAILFCLVELPAALTVHKHEDDTGLSGDGQAAFAELKANYNRVTDEVIRAKLDDLERTVMEPGENPDDFFNKKHRLRSQLEKMGETISDRRFKDICVQGFSEDYKDIKMMVFRDPSFDVQQMQATMRNIFLDEQMRKRTKGQIAGRGFAMATKTSGPICFECNEPGHVRRNCPNRQREGHRAKKTKPAGATKWCSVHNTTTHSDEECYNQGAKRPERTGKAFSACTHCVHCSTQSRDIQAKPTTTEIPKETEKTEQAEIDFSYDEDAFKGGFMYHATCSKGSGRTFTTTATGTSALVDSGASETMFDDRLIPNGRLEEERPTPKIIDVAGESQLRGTTTGILHCTIKDDKEQQLPVKLQGLIVPGPGRNIFAPTALLKKGLRCVLEDKTPHLTIGGEVVVPLKQETQDQGMCTLAITFKGDPASTSKTPPNNQEPGRKPKFGKPEAVQIDHTLHATCSVAMSVSADLWHRRLGHINPRAMEILRRNPATGVKYDGPVSPCDNCQITKHKKAPVPKKTSRVLTKPGQLVQFDNMGPIDPPAKYNGRTYSYVAKATDVFTRMREVYLLRDRTETTQALHAYNMQVASEGYRIEVLRCDKGGENTGEEMRNYCRESAIKLEFAATNTPQEIGVSERDGQTLAAVTRALLRDGDFPKHMWGELMMTAAYLTNRTPHAALGGATPYSKMYNTTPDLSRLRAIGARAFVHHERYKKKLDDRAFEGKLCGYGPDSKTYRIYVEGKDKVYESRNVTFIETPPNTIPPHRWDDRLGYEHHVMNFTSLLGCRTSTGDEDNKVDYGTQSELLLHEMRNMQQDNISRAELRQNNAGMDSDNYFAAGGADSNNNPRTTTPSRTWRDTTLASPTTPTDTDSASPAPISMRRLTVTRPATRTHQPTDDPIDPSCIPKSLEVNMNDRGRSAMAVSHPDPLELTEDQLLDLTHQAQQRCPTDAADFAHLDEDPFAEVRAYAYAMGTSSKGRFKARLVAGGHRQRAGRHFGRNYAPVTRLGSIRMLFAIACEHGWEVYQLDVVAAFLNAYTDRDVYVRPAPGDEERDPTTGEMMVYKLEKSLYGLSQSPSLWNDAINDRLIIFGWQRTRSDPCVYIFVSGDELTILAIYVDDILITGGNKEIVSRKKKELMDSFEMTDMGEVKRVIGIEVQRDYEHGTLAISQGPYARDILQRYGMEQANPVSTPGYGAELSTEQPQDQLLGPEDKQRFQAITGSLLYLAQCTRYDLSYAVHQLTRACANPAQVHMAAAKHLLRYLRGTPDLPIVYKKGQFRLSCFTDSSFGANPDNGRSTTGYLFFLGGGLISYGAKAQTLAAQNTVEAELQALSFSAREAVYISNFMTEIGFKTFRSVPINSDSTGALTVASNAMFSSRTKHIALRFFFLRELTKGHRITLHHQPSATMLADIATKHLPKQRFATIMQLIKDYKC